MLRAAALWSVGTHALFPQPARAYAEALLVVGALLAKVFGRALVDVWLSEVLPRLIYREHRDGRRVSCDRKRPDGKLGENMP